MDKLVCIITGPEHNGTTYLKNLLDSHPDIYSGFETGLLLNDDFEKSIPFKDRVYHGEFNWGLPKNINLFDKSLTIEDKYSLLYNNKGSYEGDNQKLIKESKYIVDKTPIYFANLPDVYKRLDSEDIPVIITIKNFEECYNSYVVSRNMSIENFIKRTTHYKNSLIWIKENKEKLKNIYLFSYNDTINPNFNKKLKQIISPRINVNTDLSHDNFLKKLCNPSMIQNRPYGDWKKKKEIVKIPEEFKESETVYDNLINELKEEI